MAVNERAPLVRRPEEKVRSSDWRSTIKLVACNISLASLGWHDGCIGPLIPFIQLYYGASYQTVSTLFLGSFAGFVTASIANVPMTRTLGMGEEEKSLLRQDCSVITMGAAIQGLGAGLIVLGFAQFRVMVVAYCICGFDLGIQDAQVNTYIARLPNANKLLGISHGLYGLSGMLAPVLATLLIGKNVPFRYFYVSNLTWSMLSVVTLTLGFGGGRGAARELAPPLSQEEDTLAVSRDETTKAVETHTSIADMFTTRAIWTTWLFAFLYVGSEMGEAGWIISFLLEERGAGINAGYATSAFFAGLTVSRVVLLPVTERLEEKRAVTYYLVVAFLTQLVVSIVKDFNMDLLAIGTFGFMFGPIYPVALALMVKNTPESFHTGAVGMMACLGQAGSALFPFIVGSLAAEYGVNVLQPVQFAVLGAMMLVWRLM